MAEDSRMPGAGGEPKAACGSGWRGGHPVEHAYSHPRLQPGRWGEAAEAELVLLQLSVYQGRGEGKPSEDKTRRLREEEQVA